MSYIPHDASLDVTGRIEAPDADDTVIIHALFDCETDIGERLFASGHGTYSAREVTDATHRLIGLSFEDTDEIRYLDREAVVEQYGAAQVRELEQMMEE